MGLAKKHTGRDEWKKRVERWQESGLSAEQFAAELGINAGTLKYWKYRLGSEAAARKPTFVEVPAPVAAPTTPACFELEIGGKVRLRVPGAFDGAALGRLLDVLERR